MGEINFYIDGSIPGWEATVINIPMVGKNHDVWVIKQGSVFVADGATPIHPDWPQDLQKWGTSLGSLACEYAKAPEVPLAQAWQEAIEMNNTLYVPAGNKRSAGATHVRLSEGMIETLTIGDVKLLARFKDGTVEETFDTRLDAHEQEQDELIAAGKITPLQAAETNRAKVNTPNGYYVLAASPTVGHEGLVRHYKPDTVASIVIASDGFWRLYRDMSDILNMNDFTVLYEELIMREDITDDLTFIGLKPKV
jgi:hypothetical protein